LSTNSTGNSVVVVQSIFQYGKNRLSIHPLDLDVRRSTRNEANTRRGKRSGDRAPVRLPKSLLGSIAECSKCGGRLHYSTCRSNPYYRCATCTPVHQIRGDLLEPLVCRAALMFVASLEPGSVILDTVATKMLGRFDPGTETRRDQLVDQLDALAGKVAKFSKQNLSGALEDDLYDDLMDTAAGNKRRIEDELDLLPEVKPNLGILSDLTLAADHPDDDLVGPGSPWSELPHHKQREILRVLLDKVVIAHDGGPSENVYHSDFGGRVAVTFVTEDNVLQFASRTEKTTVRYTQRSKVA